MGELPKDPNSLKTHDTDSEDQMQDQPSRTVERLSDIEIDALLTELLNERQRRTTRASE